MRNFQNVEKRFLIILKMKDNNNGINAFVVNCNDDTFSKTAKIKLKRKYATAHNQYSAIAN
jgi:hypothetical protein